MKERYEKNGYVCQIKSHYKEHTEQAARFKRFARGTETAEDNTLYKGNNLLHLERFLWEVRGRVQIRPDWSFAVYREHRRVEWRLSIGNGLYLQGEGILTPSDTHPTIGETYITTDGSGERIKVDDFELHVALRFVFGVFIRQPPQLRPCDHKNNYLVENIKGVLKHRFPNHKFEVWKDGWEPRVAHEDRLSCWAVSEALRPFEWNSWTPPDIPPFAKVYGDTPRIMIGTFEEFDYEINKEVTL